jgi:hypothetical protein
MTQAHSVDARGITERAIRDLTTIGKAWARYGLTVSKIALETSATTLQRTAAVLGDLSKPLQDDEAEKPEASASEPKKTD